LAIYRNERYGNVYVVDRPGLERALGAGRCRPFISAR
jgi:hypothetical protein